MLQLNPFNMAPCCDEIVDVLCKFGTTVKSNLENSVGVQNLSYMFTWKKICLYLWRDI